MCIPVAQASSCFKCLNTNMTPMYTTPSLMWLVFFVAAEKEFGSVKACQATTVTIPCQRNLFSEFLSVDS